MSEFWQGFIEGGRAAPRNFFLPLTMLWRLLTWTARASVRKVRQALS